jgi:uncharacterized protein YjbJ (UPF0337 family)
MKLGTRKGFLMGDRTQRVKGKANEVKGKAKARTAYRTGNTSSEVKGAATAYKGKAQQTAAKARSKARKHSS